MITQYPPKQLGADVPPCLILEGDLAGEFPLYLYWPHDRSKLLYSSSISELIEDARVPKPLKISNQGLSFLLQSGVVPPPMTAYEDIYIVGIGDKAKVTWQNGKVKVDFSHKFPFMNADRMHAESIQPDEDLILKLLAEATIKRVDESKPSFLFHSAGKDSNTIALALAEAGWQDKVVLITHKSKGKADESQISAKIAKQLGFKHKILKEIDQLEVEHHRAINNYFRNAPFPCTDTVTLAYPLYAYQAPELFQSNLIFGDGNDSHMISPPDKRQYRVLPYSRITSQIGFVRRLLNSESILNALTRTPAEWFGKSGLSFKDSLQIYPDANSVQPYWLEESRVRRDWDIFDFKSDIYATRTITERMIRKLFNFAESIDSKTVLPFANNQVAEYFARMPEAYLFDRKSFKNKLILRKMLKERIGLDSDSIGKMGWVYDAHTVVIRNLSEIRLEISSCKLWSEAGLNRVLPRFLDKVYSSGRSGTSSRSFIYRLYLISAWYNRNRYLQ